MIALDSEGRQSFRDLRAGRGNLHYAAFDALWMDGKDLRPLMLARRKQFLTSLIPATTTVLSQVFSIEERGRDMFAAAERLDFEGIVAKRKADAYRPETVWVQDQESDPHAGRRSVGAISEEVRLRQGGY